MIHHAIVTEPNRERTAWQELEWRGFAPYLPLDAVLVRRDRGRTRWTQRPLIPGYVFVPTNNRWPDWFAIRGARGVLMAGDRPAPIAEREMAMIRAVEAELASRKSGPVVEYRPGDRVRVIEGPLAMQSATVDALDSVGKITVWLKMLGTVRRVTMPAAYLAAMRKPA